MHTEPTSRRKFALTHALCEYFDTLDSAPRATKKLEAIISALVGARSKWSRIPSIWN